LAECYADAEWAEFENHCAKASDQWILGKRNSHFTCPARSKQIKLPKTPIVLATHNGIVYFLCIMAFKTLTVRTEAYARLKKLKAPGESFSDVILREMPEPWETCGDVLDGLRNLPVPRPDPKLMAAVLKGRGRRSPRE
jgi:hypothetical protein